MSKGTTCQREARDCPAISKRTPAAGYLFFHLIACRQRSRLLRQNPISVHLLTFFFSFILHRTALLLSNIFSQSSSLSLFCQVHYIGTHRMLHLWHIYLKEKCFCSYFRSLLQCVLIPSIFQVYVLTGRCIVTVLCNQRLKTQTKRLRKPVST